MIRRGKVSVWLGHMGSENELLAYVDDGKFSRDFDFAINPEIGRELTALPYPVPVLELVEGFSSWELFEEECIRQAESMGFHEGNCMVVLYAFEYLPSKMVNPNAPLKFLGVFDF